MRFSFKIHVPFVCLENDNREALHSQHYGSLQARRNKRKSCCFEILSFVQIVDSKGSQLAYEALEKSEKEKILADLLIQTALQNISDQQNIVKQTTHFYPIDPFLSLV